MCYRQRPRTILPMVLGTVGLALLLNPARVAAENRAAVNLDARLKPPSGTPVVGAYYYPWYGVASRSPTADWKQVFRRRLKPAQLPAAGLYRSQDPPVIAQHLRQCRRAQIAFWAVSWWGPGSPTDRLFQEALLAHPDAQDFRFAVLYESTGRLGTFDKPNYENWVNDLAYLEKHYFDRPNYLRIDGRPALFVYLTREYFRDKGQAALAEGKRRFPQAYLIGDDVFGPHYRRAWAEQFDAVTVYDVYGQSAGAHGASHKAIDVLASNYRAAREAANAAGKAFIPTVAPGYNDAAVRDGHPGVPRYLVDEPKSAEGDFFRAMIRDAALPNLDDRAGRMMMVTSFNEWYEDTQIEPTAGKTPPTTADDSETGDRLTLGLRYEDYGSLYLDILNEAIAGAGGAP